MLNPITPFIKPDVTASRAETPSLAVLYLLAHVDLDCSVVEESLSQIFVLLLFKAQNVGPRLLHMLPADRRQREPPLV